MSTRACLLAVLLAGVVITDAAGDKVTLPRETQIADLKHYAEGVDEHLREIYVATVLREGAAWSDTTYSSREWRTKLAECRNHARPADEQKFIVDQLLAAYEKDPRDYLTIEIALHCALYGVKDPRVAQIAQELVVENRKIPNDGLRVMRHAFRLLAATGEEQNFNLVRQCISREVSRVTTKDSHPYLYGPIDPRQEMRFYAITTLYEFMPVREALKVFKSLAKQYPYNRLEMRGAVTYQMTLVQKIDQYLEYLKVLRRGGTPNMPVL